MMAGLEQQLLALVSKHAARGILVDTNVLLLHLCGQYMPSALGQKRLAKYTLDDASLISQFLERFATIFTTQHVLAETSNLARQIVSGKQLWALSERLYPLFCLETPDSFTRCNVDGTVVDINIFARLGLTDAGLASLVHNDTLLLTDDLDLYVAAVSMGGDAVNFSHMREAAGTV